MSGTGDNLAAMLDDKYRRANLSGATEREESPIEEAVSLMVREALTGRNRLKVLPALLMHGAIGSMKRQAAILRRLSKILMIKKPLRRLFAICLLPWRWQKSQAIMAKALKKTIRMMKTSRLVRMRVKRG